MGSTFTPAPLGHVFCYVGAVMWEHPEADKHLLWGLDALYLEIHHAALLFTVSNECFHFLKVEGFIPCFFCGCVQVGVSL